jgi:hypothetical protein
VSAYEIKTVTVTTTSQVVVTADSDVDRRVHFVSGSPGAVNWSFDGVNSAKISFSSPSVGLGVSLVLPADEELQGWIDQNQNPAAVGLVVTKA